MLNYDSSFPVLSNNSKISSDGTNIQPEVNDAGNKQPFPSEEMPTHSRSSIDPVPPPRIKKSRVVRPLTKQNELLQKACALLELADTPQNNVPSIALAWGEKLLSLEPQQKNFAEKAINDILFEASLGTLNRNSVKINEEYTPNPPLLQNFYYHNTESSSSRSTQIFSPPPTSHQNILEISVNNSSSRSVNSPAPILHELKESSQIPSCSTTVHNYAEETNELYFSRFGYNVVK
ncbi:hypothetical protein RN001_001905 [Aquatica leii]|uniref:Uncharacterized protein n=1 Tax=Aquatica leii TaxID=1421715 RepID=A0AAN7Q4P3_9COLE|nr:hypothetical protein RN001_001905 [Aquatica leii]